jgi:uncharacterized protein
MKINVSSVKHTIGSHQPFCFQCNIDQLSSETENMWINGQVLVEGTIVNNGRMLEMQGNIKAQAHLECGRCLEPFDSVFMIPFRELFQEESSLTSAEPSEQISSFQGDEIDISDLVRETLVLAEPLKKVCSEHCKGLCPKCGINLNTGSCDCETESIDPRLAALKKLLQND